MRIDCYFVVLCTANVNAFERIESFPVRACPRETETTERENFTAFVRNRSSDPSATEIVYDPDDYSDRSSFTGPDRSRPFYRRSFRVVCELSGLFVRRQIASNNSNPNGPTLLRGKNVFDDLRRREHPRVLIVIIVLRWQVDRKEKK